MKPPKTVSESVKRLNPEVYGFADLPKPKPLSALDLTVACPIAASTDEAKLNKTEQAYLNYIRCLGFAWIGVQNLTLKLADDTRYTPDFVTVDVNGHLDCREVKGFFRDDAKVKIKVAARMFPWITFQVVRKTDKGWEHQIVKP